jgi:hypothetical protein
LQQKAPLRPLATLHSSRSLWLALNNLYNLYGSSAAEKPVYDRFDWK